MNIQTRNNKVIPFLNWAGGKRWFVANHLSKLPPSFERYIEPFLGSGAVFFKLNPKRAILSDINEELIITYKAIRDDWQLVLKHLKKHQKNHCKDYYYIVRKKKPRTIYSLAARLIYLNRTCWNGLYRVNKGGEFNVPIGTKTSVLLDTDNFAGVAESLRGARLENVDFEKTIDKARKGDLLFVDPPYTIKHANNGFIKYNEKLFHCNDQVRLSECLIRAKKRGAYIVLTNSDNKYIRKLYRNSFEIKSVNRSSTLAADSHFRGIYQEIIVKSF